MAASRQATAAATGMNQPETSCAIDPSSLTLWGLLTVSFES
jgi:hypothetical protein